MAAVQSIAPTSGHATRQADQISDAEVDIKYDVAHNEKTVDTTAGPVIDGLEAEAAWVRSLSPEEYAEHNRKLVRKVS